MTTIALYGNKPLTSPYVFSVFVALEEKALPFELRYVALDQREQLTAEFIARSVTNRVPTLTHGEFSLAESSAITEYLEDAFPPPEYTRLYPADPKQRGRVRMVQALLRSDFMPIRGERSTETVFRKASAGALSVAAIGEVDRLYRIAGQLVSGAGSTVADSFSLADVDLALMLQRLLSNNDPMPEPLAAYATAIWQRPSIQKWLTLAAAD